MKALGYDKRKKGKKNKKSTELGKRKGEGREIRAKEKNYS